MSRIASGIGRESVVGVVAKVGCLGGVLFAALTMVTAQSSTPPSGAATL